MQDAVLVAEVDALEELVHEGLDGGGLEGAALAVGVHVTLEVAVHVLEDEHELVFGVDDVVERYDVFVLQFLHERDFSDRCRRRAFFRVKVDFFQGDQFARLAVSSFEDLAY